MIGIAYTFFVPKEIKLLGGCFMPKSIIEMTTGKTNRKRTECLL